MQKETIESSCYFEGNASKNNYDVQLKFKFTESELMNAIQFIAGIGKQVLLLAYIEKEKIPLGTFSIYSIRIDRDGNTVIAFKSRIDDVIVNNFPKLMVEEAVILLKAKIKNKEC